MKKLQKSLCLLLTCLMLALALSGCGSSDTTSSTDTSVGSGEGYPVTITNYDYQGQETTFEYQEAPERVVVVYQGCIETMAALGLEDRVIAAYGLDNEIKDEWKDALDKMNYDDTVFAPDKETVTALDPDMIFSWGSLFSDKNLGDTTTWNEKGVATYMSSNTVPGGTRTIENEYNDLLNIGKIFGVEDKAEELVNEMKEKVEAAVEAAKDQEAVTTVVCEPTTTGITNYGANQLAGDMVTQLGATLSIPDATSISKEDLIAANPDTIFVVYMPRSDGDDDTVMNEQLNAIKGDESLQSLDAVKNDRVYAIMLGDMYASGPRTLDGIETFSEGLYPDLSK